MAVLNAWQMRRQRLATCAWPFRFSYRGTRFLVGKFLDFCFESPEIFVTGFLEQILLDAGQCFVFDTIAKPAEMCQFQDKCLDFEVFGLQGRFIGLSLLLRLVKQRLDHRSH